MPQKGDKQIPIKTRTRLGHNSEFLHKRVANGERIYGGPQPLRMLTTPVVPDENQRPTLIGFEMVGVGRFFIGRPVAERADIKRMTSTKRIIARYATVGSP
jgi:hypothetical protein